MARVTLKSIVLGLAMLIIAGTSLVAQTNAKIINHNVLSTESLTSAIYSQSLPEIISEPEYGSLNINVVPVGQNLYQYIYRPSKDEEIIEEAVIEYYVFDEDLQLVVPSYTTLKFNVAASIVIPKSDYIYIHKNEQKLGIEVVEDDFATHGPLTISDIAYVSGGDAFINANKIDFYPALDFTGEAFVYYQVADTLGKTGVGKLKVMVAGDQNTFPSSINAITTGLKPIELTLPIDGLEIQGETIYGNFTFLEGRYLYTPTQNVDGQESFVLSNGESSISVDIQLIAENNSNTWVKDDVVYTTKATPVTFNVEENDLKQNQEYISYSSELVAGSQSGEFTFNPRSYYVGTRKLEYTVFNGYQQETGEILVKVNNFVPKTNYDYNFTCLSNSALVIDYAIPVSNFSFELVENAAHGNVFINDGSGSINVGCSEIEGQNLIIYQPDFSYKGEDEFTVNYCTNDQCWSIAITVNVVSNTIEGCECFTDCVWAGDANNDGLVNALDFLSVAYNIGKTGPETEWNGLSGWIGRNTTDWANPEGLTVNPKYSDADGNGTIDALDIDYIISNYDKNHALVPPQLLDNKRYPFSLVPAQDTFSAGDLLTFNLLIGNEYYPAIDVYGFSYALGFPASMVDSASFFVDYPNGTWLSGDQAVAGITKQISKGRIESAASRIHTQPKSGKGKVGSLGFIVEEDIVGGFRVKNGIIPVTITIEDGTVMQYNGELASIPGTEVTVYIDINKDIVRESDIIAYPNPSSDIINLHLNGGKSIYDYEVYDMLGNRVSLQKNINSRQAQINVSGLSVGTYIIKANTDTGPEVTKIQVIR